MRSGWMYSSTGRQTARMGIRRNGPRPKSVASIFGALSLLTLAPAQASYAQKGVPMTPERLDSLTESRTLELRLGASSLTQVLPSVTQQMLYRVRLTPDAPDLPLSVFCSGAKLSDFEHAITSLFGYKLLGRSQGEGMGLVFFPDPAALAAAGRGRLQGRTAVEAGIERALDWLKQPAQIAAIARTRCPSAGTLRDPAVKRAFLLHAALSPAQHAEVMAGHPVIVPLTALPARARTLLPTSHPAPRWLAFYLYSNPWLPGDALRLAVRAGPAGPTWLSCPPLDLVPAHYPETAGATSAFKSHLTGMPDLEDLDPGEEAPAFLEWIADQGKIWIMAEALQPSKGSGVALKKLAASCQGLTVTEALDRVAAEFGATWRLDHGWVLIQRRSVRGL